METEIGKKTPQTRLPKAHKQAPEDRSIRKQIIPPQPLEETWPCQHRDIEMTFAYIWPPEL